MQDQWLATLTTASAAPPNQIAVAGVVALLGERLGRIGVLACLLVLAASGFSLFNLTVSASAHAALSVLFGLMISGFLFARLISMLQLSAHADRIGAVAAFGLRGFYTPGPCAGYLFGKLVVLFGWGTASMIMVALPALLPPR
jgi:hypothetical protein